MACTWSPGWLLELSMLMEWRKGFRARWTHDYGDVLGVKGGGGPRGGAIAVRVGLRPLPCPPDVHLRFFRWWAGSAPLPLSVVHFPLFPFFVGGRPCGACMSGGRAP